MPEQVREEQVSSVNLKYLSVYNKFLKLTSHKQVFQIFFAFFWPNSPNRCFFNFFFVFFTCFLNYRLLSFFKIVFCSFTIFFCSPFLSYRCFSRFSSNFFIFISLSPFSTRYSKTLCCKLSRSYLLS